MPSWTWTDTNQVQATAGVLSVIVTFVGFLLIWRQIKQVDSSARGQTHSYLYTHQDSITHFFIDNPNLRPFFYDNKDLSGTESEIITLRAATEMVADFSEHIYLQLPNLPVDIREGWEFYMKTLYNRSPMLRIHFEVNGDWYSEEFIKIISSSYVDLEIQKEGEDVTIART